MKQILSYLTACLLPFTQGFAAPAEKPDASSIPYPVELDKAAVSQPGLFDLDRNALAIGNGDLNALVWERNGEICLRIAKNDIWDARIDTSQDGPLVKVDVAQQKWTSAVSQPSTGTPYPTPRPAAIVRLGTGESRATNAWKPIRSEGVVNEWYQKSADVGVMAVEGKAGASAGFQTDIPAGTAHFQQVQFKITGTPGAQYYVELQSTAGMVKSGWKDSPITEETVTLASSGNISAVFLYVMTRDGKRAENRIREITLTGDAAPLALAANAHSTKAALGTLDLRRAVATVGDVTVRARICQQQNSVKPTA